MATALGALVWLIWPRAATLGDAPRVPDAPAIAGTIGADPAPLTPSSPDRDPVRTAAIPDEPRPGTLTGRVIDGYGNPFPGIEVALVGDEGVIDQVTVEADGTYHLEDDLLIADRVVVARQERPISPLMAGEARTLDLVVGETRAVVGWVLDLAGDPVAGVRVTLRGEQAKASWSAWTDGNGAFTFAYAPATVVRVTADGGELGMSSVRLAQTDAQRREVTLVLEPTGTLIVHARAGLGEEVLVRVWDAEAHGTDGVYADDLREPVPRPLEFEAQMMETLTESLKTFDPKRPEESLVRFALELADIDPSVKDELRRDAVQLDPNLAGSPLDEVVRAAVMKVMRDEPQIIEMMTYAADAVKQGKTGMDALMEAGQKMAERQIPPEPEPGEAEAAEYVEIPEPEVAIEVEPGLEGLDEGGPVFAEPEVEPYVDPVSKVRDETGAALVEFAGEERAVVARGAIGAEIPVRGAFVYQVALRRSDGVEIGCGEVLVPAGQVVEMRCGESTEARITGRVVDTNGRPIEGLTIDGAFTPLTSATSDERGRFELRGPTDRALATEVTVTDPRQVFGMTVRLNVSVIPAGRMDLGTIVVRRPDEAPDMAPSGPFGGVGAALSQSHKGIVMSGVAPESPLGLEGVEDGATVLSIDDQDAITLSIEDAVSLLRGDLGTEVALRLRSAEGELYDVLVQRGLIDPQGPTGPTGPTGGEHDMPLDGPEPWGHDRDGEF